MDEKNRRDIMTYSSEVSSLNDKNPYERKIAVRNILGTFLTDWD
jgi:hypothetical protein